MVSIKKAIKAMQEALELNGRAKALGALRTMDRHWLEENGFSIEALEQGISAWPWRKAELDHRHAPMVAELGPDTAAQMDDPANDLDHQAAA